MVPTTFTNIRNMLISLLSKFNYYHVLSFFKCRFWLLVRATSLILILLCINCTFNKLFLHYTPTSILQHIVVSLPYTSYNTIVELLCRLVPYFTFSYNKSLITFSPRFMTPINIITNIEHSIHHKYPYD